tara:strand:+ start:150 stop:1292 length:1143 start_codon:yes stop_codon:yes gene_type:complete
MFRPQIQKTSTLVLIAIFNLLMVYLSVNSKYSVKLSGYQDKVEATKNMIACIDEIKENATFEVSELDKYHTGLIGVNSSKITTKVDIDSSMIESKVIVTNPNFAAYIIDKFYELGISDGHTIAVSMTGSLPGANIALLSACKAMNIKPVIISSAGSSSWGANREAFSWPYIESLLYSKGLIKNKSMAYSMGGVDDLGTQLPDEGIEIFESVIPDDAIFVNEKTLYGNILKKLELFNIEQNNYSLYVNIGGGAASLGGYIVGLGDHKDTLDVGLITITDAEEWESEGFKTSIAHSFLFNDEESIPMLNIKNIKKLFRGNSLDDFMNSKNYEGNLFYRTNAYNPIVILLALFLSIVLIFVIGIYSHFQIKKRMESNEVDAIL